MDGVKIVEVKCECGNTQTGSPGVFIDTNNGEVVCRKCGLVQENFVWMNNDVYEK